jgi:3'(2'), 5'-bisphosphate nucleotidase
MVNITEINDLGRKAGAAILKVYASTTVEIEAKSDTSPLTLADRRSNDVICAGLKDLAPDIPIISEENREIPYSERKSFQQVWLVDPLDGTKEFIKRNGEFTVNIALIENGAAILGCVYVPVTGDLYYAVKGEGAFHVSAGETRRLQPAEFSMDDPGLKVVCSRSHLNDDTKKFMEQLNAPEIVSRGSSLKFMLIASGQAHVYPRLAPTMEWDTAAAQCIVEEAGGKVLEFSDRQPMRYNKENLLNPFFVATGKGRESQNVRVKM